MKPYQAFLPLMAACMSLAGCIDDKYDLSDVDTNVRVNVNNLVIPVNIDQVTMKSILSLDDDSKIKEINGGYAFVEDGTFSSNIVSVSAPRITAPYIAPTRTSINLSSARQAPVSRASSGYSFDISTPATSFSASATGVNSSIVGIDRAGCSATVGITVSVPALSGKLKALRLGNVKMKLPRGLVLDGNYDYDPATGIINLGNVEGTGTSVSVSFKVKAIDATKAAFTYDYDRHVMTIADEMAFTSATLAFTDADLNGSLASLPQSFDLVTAFTLSDINITTFTGRIKYDIEGVNISDVNINDLPDVLTQEGTDIRIANPQIYLTISNPFHSYGLIAEAGLAITAFKGAERVGTYTLDDGIFTIRSAGNSADCSYYMSPTLASPLYPGYANPTHVPYTALSNVLSGNGMPTRLAVSFGNPRVPVQQVTDFALGRDYGRVSGKYTFYAPLQLANGSTIIYTDVVDGWSSEDLDHVTIETLEVHATVRTDIPIALNFTGWPIDVNGNRINNVAIEGAKINANASGQEVVIRITGQIRGLDGIRFTADAVAAGSDKPLSPDMNIFITNLRPVVSGYYEKEL